MAPEASSNVPKAGLSLYANLLDPSSSSTTTPGTISRAPVVFKQSHSEDSRPDEGPAQKQQISAASLRFQPTKRPQLSAQKPKSKSSVQKAIPPRANDVSQESVSVNTKTVTQKPVTKVTLADWTADGDDEDVNGFFGGEKRQRGGRKKRKKNKEETSTVAQNWDDIYDPSRPNSYEEYKNSDEKISELREWKDKLYAHRVAGRRTSDTDDSEPKHFVYQKNRTEFAPPPGLSFAPPTQFDDIDVSPPNTTSIPDDPTGEDAYARRIRLSQAANQPVITTPVPGTPQGSIQSPDVPPIRTPPAPPTAVGITAPSIFRAPVRYNLPPAPSEIPESEAELADALQADEPEKESTSEPAARSLRPGQKGFAERLMSKYGWTKGSGLGADGAGIVNPLRVQVEKQKKKPDSEGGGFAAPGGRGKILGGKKQGKSETTGKFGAMSEVVALYGMVDGMDLDAELEGLGDGGIMQEIGDECGEKYGRVERVFIDRSNPSKAPVFVKFTSQLSALRAVNALEGRIFNGNTITARFFDIEKFENGVYA